MPMAWVGPTVGALRLIDGFGYFGGGTKGPDAECAPRTRRCEPQSMRGTATARTRPTMRLLNGPGTITVLESMVRGLQLTGRFPRFVVPPARAEEIYPLEVFDAQPATESSPPAGGGSRVAERSPNVVNNRQRDIDRSGE
jgi:hypothetical protein